MHKSICVLLTVLLAAVAVSDVRADDPTLWRVQLDSWRLGPVEFHLRLSGNENTIRGKSLSGATALLRDLPGEHDIQEGLFVFEATRQSDGSFAGALVSPWKKGGIKLHFDDGELHGSISDGVLAGRIVAHKVTTAAAIRDYPAVLDALDVVVAARLYAPDDIQGQAYKDFRSRLGQIAAAATDDLDLLFGFHWAWQNDPFSHFEFKRSGKTAEQLFAYFDEYRVGFAAATVEFDDGIATLTVRTMMGADTIEQIEAAYDRIAAENPAALIIDLRGNSGGAFAVKPLVEHVIDEPLDAGYFLSQVWNRGNDRLPSTTELQASEPWTGWSITAFWKSVQESEIVRLRFNPATPNYDGPVFVLLDDESASATELAADALRASGIVTIIGQPTAGEMLSQSMFDVADGFIVSLPVADYFSVTHGRIEGVGVPVDIVAESQQAPAVARQLAKAVVR